MILLVSSTLPKIQTDFILSIVFRPDMTYNVFSGTLNPTLILSIVTSKISLCCMWNVAASVCTWLVYFCVAVHLSWLVNVCFCCVRFSFSIPSQEIGLEKVSKELFCVKWWLWLQVGCNKPCRLAGLFISNVHVFFKCVVYYSRPFLFFPSTDFLTSLGRFSRNFTIRMS